MKTTQVQLIIAAFAVLALASLLLANPDNSLSQTAETSQLSMTTDNATPTASGTATITLTPANLPDLVIAGAGVWPHTARCVVGVPYTFVDARNEGSASAGRFWVTVGLWESTCASWNVEGLGINESVHLKQEGGICPGEVRVDAGNAVMESDETNNTAIIPVPTDSLTCTPVPPTATPDLGDVRLPLLAKNWFGRSTPAPTADTPVRATPTSEIPLPTVPPPLSDTPTWAPSPTLTPPPSPTVTPTPSRTPSPTPSRLLGLASHIVAKP